MDRDIKFLGTRKSLLILGDIFIIVIIAYATINMAVRYSGAQVEMDVYYGMLPIMVVVSCILFNIYGLFSLAFKQYYEVVVGLAVAMLNFVIIIMAISFFIREFGYSRSILLVAMILQFILLSFWKYLFWRIENAFVQPRNSLLLGSPVECERVLGHLQVQPHLKYQVKHVCIECNEGQWKKVANDIDLFIICSGVTLLDRADIVHYCHVHNKQVIIVPGFYELFCSSVDLDMIDDIPVFRPRYLKPTLEERTLKRMLDIVVSIGILLLAWPLFLIIPLAIKLDSHGSAFYSQIRVGMDGKEFRIYKFRTMQSDAEILTGPVMAEGDDYRITNVGRFLRATRFDELPQLFNVLLNNMSIVGPRPERPFFVDRFKKEIPEYGYRHNIKPGITGMAQVYGRYDTTPRDKLVYDLIYIQQCNVITDLVIILQTLKVVVFNRNAQGVAGDRFKPDLSKYHI